MYGMVNKAIQDLVTIKFGEDKWEAVKRKAGVEIDPDGKLIQAWRGVKVEGHIKEVLQFIKQHNSI